eukprot:gene1623-12748_t
MECRDDMNPYHILGVNRNSSPREIKQAYRKMALKYHPDRIKGEINKKNAEKQFQKISRAYEILKDPKKKRSFDFYGETDEREHYYERRNYYETPDFETDFDNFFNFQHGHGGMNYSFHFDFSFLFFVFLFINCFGMFACCFMFCSCFCCGEEEKKPNNSIKKKRE